MMVYAVVFALLLGTCLFFGLPRVRARQQILSAGIYLALIGVVYAGSIGLMGLPKPARLEWGAPEDAKVIAAKLDEGKAIYVWVQTQESPEPRAYALPWDTKMARQLNEAMQKGRKDGSEVRMSMRGEDGDARRQKFYAEPQPPLPDKGDPGGGAIRYRRPGL